MCTPSSFSSKVLQNALKPMTMEHISKWVFGEMNLRALSAAVNPALLCTSASHSLSHCNTASFSENRISSMFLGKEEGLYFTSWKESRIQKLNVTKEGHCREVHIKTLTIFSCLSWNYYRMKYPRMSACASLCQGINFSHSIRITKTIQNSAHLTERACFKNRTLWP